MAVVATAVVSAVELGTFAAIATAVAEVGVAMSVVGAVTGNKNLAKWGGYLGLAGGVGSLASSAINAVGAATAADAGSGWVSAEGGSGFADGLASDAATSSASSSVLDAATKAGSSETMGDPTMSLDSVNTGPVDANGYTPTAGDNAEQIAADKIDNPYLDQGTDGTPATQNGATNYQDYANGPRDPGAPQTPQQAVAATSPVNVSPNGAVTPPPDTSSNGLSQWFKSLDKKTQGTVLQTAAGAASGLFQGWTAEQKQALEREKFNLDKEKYSTAITNASAQPSIKFAPIGIINSPAKA